MEQSSMLGVGAMGMGMGMNMQKNPMNVRKEVMQELLTTAMNNLILEMQAQQDNKLFFRGWQIQ